MTGRNLTAMTTTPLDPEPSPPADATHVSDWELWNDQDVFRYYSTDCGHGVALSLDPLMGRGWAGPTSCDLDCR